MYLIEKNILKRGLGELLNVLFIISSYRIEIYLDGVDFSRLPDVKFLD